MEQIFKIWHKRLYSCRNDIKMKLKHFIFLLFFFLLSCVESTLEKKISKKEKKYYSSSGFALIYDEKAYENKIINKKINNDEIVVFHKFLKKNTLIRITNPETSLSIETKIKNKAKYPNIFTILISKKIASILKLEKNNPFVEITELKKNKKFKAKVGEMFDEEKNVAEKAPIDKVLMDNLSVETQKSETKNEKKDIFTIIISDFYFLESATNLKKELLSKTNISIFVIKKINDKKYRLSVGPFNNFNSLKSTYISLNNLGFNNLNIYKN